jgi:hypothetical protein
VISLDLPNHKPFHIEGCLESCRGIEVIVFNQFKAELRELCVHEVEHKGHVSDRKFRVPERKIVVTYSKQKG